jgi:phosphodiesterase/alkaline phosphatase D-like protein
MKNHRPDLALFCGDNCYYVNNKGTTSLPGEPDDRPRDWESTERMLIRQVEARNHPQFRRLSRSIPLYSTWDDHDFGYNNAQGSDRTDYWVGRDIASAVFRAMWPNPYLASGIDWPILYSFRWGPVEVFMTDSRFRRKANDPAGSNTNFIWGADQTEWLREGLANSPAPLKIVVTSGQFLFNQNGEDGHLTEAPMERSAVLDTVINIPGRVLFLSGDMHYSELQRFPRGSGAVTALEFTNSPIRRTGLTGAVNNEVAPGCRIWAGQHNGFGTVTVDIEQNDKDGGIIGTVILEAWAVEEDDGGVVSRRLLTTEDGRNCRSTWNLSDGTVT